MRIPSLLLLVSLLVAPATIARSQEAAGPAFRLTFNAAALAEPFTGRVFVTLTRAEPRPIVRDLDWFNPQQTVALDVKDWKPGTPITLGAAAMAYPKAIKDIAKGRLYAQAILDRDLGGISMFSSPGNLYSQAKAVEFDPAGGDVVELLLDKTVEPTPFRETDNVKLVDIQSELLSNFHGKPMRMRAGVVLPPSFAIDKDKTYPVVYEATGFGGDHFAAHGVARRRGWDLDGTEAIWVVLDANCRLGHHVFADSANNGPCGAALVEELIPHIEKTYRGIGKPSARLVTGHSSGGWSSLWLQVAYPDTFGGCWSTSPDPVDFRDFQRINLYEPGANLFRDPAGDVRELSRGGFGRALTFESFSAMEDIMGRGGQLGSFEAVFSPRAADGRPQKLWDRKTGAIDTATAKAWEKYDIRLKLEREWPALGPKLAGKIHVWMGELDTFYLDGATRLLQKSQAELGSDAVIEMFAGKTHGLVDRMLQGRMNGEMSAALGKGR